MAVSDVLSAISDDKSLVLFNTIALASGDSSILISRLNLIRMQYYSRMFALINAGLVRRINGKYFVTSFGKVVYKAQELIGTAVQYSSKLKAIDSVESPAQLVDQNNIGVNMEKTFSLAEAGKALDYQKDVHPKGKVVLAM